MVLGGGLPNGAATVSLRWLLPFLRVTGTAPGELSLPTQEGVAPAELADPLTRVRHAAFVGLVQQLEKQVGFPGLGLRAGARLEVNELGVFGHALRSCATLRTAISWAGRYVRLVHGALECQLFEDGQLARLELRVIDHVPQPALLNDFLLAAALTIARQLTGLRPELHEVHFKHASAADPLEYKRAFGRAVLRFGERRNAVVFARECLDCPSMLAHPILLRACEAQADALLEDLYRSEGTRGRVRQLLIARLNQAQPSFDELAQELALNRSTARRGHHLQRDPPGSALRAGRALPDRSAPRRGGGQRAGRLLAGFDLLPRFPSLVARHHTARVSRADLPTTVCFQARGGLAKPSRERQALRGLPS
jgi:hypothetical protein